MTSCILALILLASPAADTKKAKAYLKEVQKHLLESFVDRDRLSEDQLTKAGLKGLAAAADHKDCASLDADRREAIRRVAKDAKTLDAALDAVAELVEEKFDFLKFADHAAHAMVKETGDPYSRILTQEDFNKLLKMMQGGSRDDQFGASVVAGTGEVMYVQYGTPAYEDGIEIGDVVIDVDGASIKGRSQDELNEMLKVKPEGIQVTVRRPGHKGTYTFAVSRRKTVKDVRFEYLGEGIGYLRMTIFDMKLGSEVKKGLEELKKLGMTKLILDLRHNPGGALPASTEVADLLLPQGLVITTTESNYKPNFGGMELPGFGGDQEYKTKKKTDFEEMPLVVLINHASASASELLSGALQDHKRGKLIGETTYGKGVGQSPIFLNSVFQQRYLYLTVMTYKLPTGRSIHHKGVVPDVEYKEDKIAPDVFAEIWKIRQSGAFDRYIEKNGEKNGDLLKKLAANDGFEHARYPGFDALFSSLRTSLSKDQIRAELRRSIRRHLSLKDGTIWVCDLETDVQLQRGLVELLDAK